MNVVQRFVFGCLCCLLLANASPLRAADKLPTEEDYYPITPFAIPEGIVLEAGGVELLPDGKLAISTRRGDIYLLDKPFSKTGKDVKFTQFASGLHEVLGIAYRDGWIYATHRPDVSRLKDVDGDGRALREERHQGPGPQDDRPEDDNRHQFRGGEGKQNHGEVSGSGPGNSSTFGIRSSELGIPNQFPGRQRTAGLT